MKKAICFLTLLTLIAVGQVWASSDLSIEVFGIGGDEIDLSESQVQMIASECPGVRQIIAAFEKSARGGTNLYISYISIGGTWKKVSAEIENPNAPTYWHILKLIKDDLQ